MIKTKKISLHSQKNIEDILIKIKEVDKRIDPLDREILACAVESNAIVFVTLDNKLIKNPVLENKFNINCVSKEICGLQSAG